MWHDEPVIHPRISQRHPEISAEDVAAAWASVLLSTRRADEPGVWVSIGLDGRGRLLELVSVPGGGRSLADLPRHDPALAQDASGSRSREKVTMMDYSVKLTEEQMERIAAEHDAGTWSGPVSPPIPGRPRLYDEELETISFRLGASRIRAVDDAADKLGESRSHFLRRAVDQALERLAAHG